MADLITRERVRALLHVAETPGASVDTPAELLAALCRRWLDVEEAHTVKVWAGPDGESDRAYMPDWSPIKPGQIVRIVLAGDGNG